MGHRHHRPPNQRIGSDHLETQPFLEKTQQNLLKQGSMVDSLQENNNLVTEFSD